MAQTYDGGGTVTTNPSLPLLQSYNSWVAGAANTLSSADPDNDGISNLVEYAFGGSPTQGSVNSPDGRSLVPKIDRAGNNMVVRYPRRTDASARGLVETPEFSSTLVGSWDSTLPPGTIVSAAPFNPVSNGFEQVTMTIPLTSQRRLVRVKVNLTE